MTGQVDDVPDANVMPISSAPIGPVELEDTIYQDNHVRDDDNEGSDDDLRKEHSESEVHADSEPDRRYQHRRRDENGDDNAETDRPELESDRERRPQNGLDEELSVLRKRKCVICDLSADAYEQALVGSEWTDDAHAGRRLSFPS